MAPAVSRDVGYNWSSILHRGQFFASKLWPWKISRIKKKKRINSGRDWPVPLIKAVSICLIIRLRIYTLLSQSINDGLSSAWDECTEGGFFFSTTVDLSPRSAYFASVTISLENIQGGVVTHEDFERFDNATMQQLASEVVWVRADSSERRAWRGGINKSVCPETLVARETRIVARGEIHVCARFIVFSLSAKSFPKTFFQLAPIESLVRNEEIAWLCRRHKGQCTDISQSNILAQYNFQT